MIQLLPKSRNCCALLNEYMPMNIIVLVCINLHNCNDSAVMERSLCYVVSLPRPLQGGCAGGRGVSPPGGLSEDLHHSASQGGAQQGQVCHLWLPAQRHQPEWQVESLSLDYSSGVVRREVFICLIDDFNWNTTGILAIGWPAIFFTCHKEEKGGRKG